MNDDSLDRGRFLNLAAAFYGGMAVAAFGLGWLLGMPPLETLKPTWRALGWGLAGALPMIALFLVSYRVPLGPLEQIQKFLVETLGPLLDDCRPHELLALALAAGLCEELLFRGVVQPWMEQWGDAFGLIGASLLFGAAHAITPTYALLAALAGLYLGVLLDAGGERNLMVPIVTHTAYDFVAFLIVLQLYRRTDARSGK